MEEIDESAEWSGPKKRRGVFQMARQQFNVAADKLDLDDGMRAVLEAASGSLPSISRCEWTPGDIRVYSGYRVQHNVVRGPAKGGLRFHPRRYAGRGKGAGHVDDVEVRHHEHSLRRRQGRRDLRPEVAVPGRVGEADAPLRNGDFAVDRNHIGHTRT